MGKSLQTISLISKLLYQQEYNPAYYKKIQLFTAGFIGIGII
ncbi:hypothetical protein ACLIJJ_17750 [Niallia sp. BSM11]